jgi:transmembrane sensor
MANPTRNRLTALISEQAAEWFVEFRTGDVDATSRSEFDAWMRASPEHLRAYVEVAAIWSESGSLRAQSQLDTDELIALARSERAAAPIVALPGVERAVRGSFRRKYISLAAALLLALTGGALLTSYQLYRAPEYSTEVGEQRSFMLSDGSTVELNSRSKLRVRFSPAERVVELVEGQALFHVAKNPARPFIVRSAQTTVRAVGTRFDVYKKQAGTVVTVLEGRVTVAGGFPSESATDSAVPLLSAGEQLAVTPRARSRPTRANVAAATAWTQRQLILENAPLSQVTEEFNRYSARKLVAEDHGDPPLRLSGVFATDPEFLLRYLRERPDIVVSETRAEVRIVREPQG